MTKYLEAGIRELVEEFQSNGKPCPSAQTIADRRAGYIGSTVLAGESPKIESEYLDVINSIPVKIYRPTDEVNLPITVYFHGGCFISGGFETHDAQLRQIALLSNSIVICIQYRLAPEHAYPAAHDDVYQAVLGIKEQAHKYGGDSEHLVFIGDSAGGQLALATTLRLKKLEQWLPRQQILIYPMLDPTGNSQSYRENGSDYIITANMLLSGFELYANCSSKEIAEPELNLLSGDFSGLPITTIITAEFDPLRDEGEHLYKLMLSQGVDAYCERYLGVIHGFFQLSGVCNSAKRCIAAISNQIKN
ncbi:TPA: alpha/beta hydrolase [Vibrio parahaemolyticus]|uniref:alpha/beta hydrolase n=1 Tax=Vibrio parahaemolyticus TaxID=670 RepID=UPI0004711594|nr:alpha/beta hydrolase [Vibrio parahaemolyticus]EGQ8107681.1 alpha/beta hydrolase [Vibrio parahaemolyticus]EKA7417675.1 alpha/beta hydrolase [Vibrio parahaemolyticus]ELA9330944.1 alpha/beta hydrolase [Vibrio parahaemolyticus]MDG2844628.1 alpha/beta hydrolase [Vibrio parahaemolyticus]MDG2865526.1 alpha/beta hydrolase [Vibrio parahaemolyticus]